MRPISPEELSALLDGELESDRAEEVRIAMSQDESLRRMYEQLAKTDNALASLAVGYQFEPRISLPETSLVAGLPVYAVAVCLLAVRVLAKVLPQGPGILLQVLAIGLLAGWLFYRLLPDLRADRWQVAHELGEVAR